MEVKNLRMQFQNLEEKDHKAFKDTIKARLACAHSPISMNLIHDFGKRALTGSYDGSV